MIIVNQKEQKFSLSLSLYDGYHGNFNYLEVLSLCLSMELALRVALVLVNQETNSRNSKMIRIT